jgi:hypothetical protein
MQRLQLVGLLTLLCALSGPVPAALAQPAREVIYCRHSVFQIPFQAGPGARNLRALKLFVSTDQGRTWLASATTTPDQRSFRFEAERDGLYWFAVQTTDRDGRNYPPAMEGVQPSLMVFVDTHPPVVALRRLEPRGREVGVGWTITDETFDANVPGAVRLEYRLANTTGWRLLPVDPTATQYYWDPGVGGNLEVRLRVRDRAENVGEDKITLAAGNSSGSNTPDALDKRPGPMAARPDANVRMVNNKRFSLNYDVKDTGPSGVSTVDLWYTQDGNNWQKYRSQKCTDSPDQRPPYRIEVEVRDEGLYGFTMVVHSGVGLSDRAPEVGDKPQVWVEVDVTRPVVQLNRINVGRGPDKGKLEILWTARDKNLTNQPITLSYAKQVDGPWIRIANQLENNGHYVWKMPADVPYEFLVKAEAVDKAGNIGTAVTPEMVKVDLSQPKVQIIGVEPVAK